MPGKLRNDNLYREPEFFTQFKGLTYQVFFLCVVIMNSDYIKLPDSPGDRIRVLMIIRGPKTFVDLAKQIDCFAGTIRGLASGAIWAPGVAKKLEIFWGIKIWKTEPNTRNRAKKETLPPPVEGTKAES